MPSRPVAVTRIGAAVAVALLLASCVSGSGESSTADEPASTSSTSPSVESASPGAVAGDYVDNKSRCTSYWNFDTTANVQLKNAIERVGVTKDWELGANEALYLKQKGKNWPSSPANLAPEGAYNCKAVPWTISNDNSKVYDYWGGEWTGPGDDDFYWGHTQHTSGAADEPNGWVSWACTADRVENKGSCPEKALESTIKVVWDAENDNWTKLERDPACEFGTSSGVGCWETGSAGSQYEGQFLFNATAWTAPLRVRLSGGSRDDKSNHIVWEIKEARGSSVIWPYGSSPSGSLIFPNKPLYVGAYAEPRNGRHAISLVMLPKYVANDKGEPLKCGTDGKCSVVDSWEEASAPVLARSIVWTVSVGITLSNVSGKTKPVVTEETLAKEACTVNPKASKLTYKCDTEINKDAFDYGVEWSASIVSS